MISITKQGTVSKDLNQKKELKGTSLNTGSFKLANKHCTKQFCKIYAFAYGVRCMCILSDENKGRTSIDSEYTAQKQVIGSFGST